MSASPVGACLPPLGWRWRFDRDPAPVVPSCCPWAGLTIEWMEAQGHGPKESGWAVAIDTTHFVNVFYCCFCGSKLPERPC